MIQGFIRWTLRTSDVERARSFYDPLLEEGARDVSELPAIARARGAVPHWLGYLAAPDVELATSAFLARGATRLGGSELLRDPSGAVLALSPPQVAARRDVVWEQLLSPEPERAKRDYAELFGMSVGPAGHVPGHGSFELFGWGSSPPRGSIGGIADKPHIHPQWLFFFRTAGLERALSSVRTHGGTALGITPLPDGRQVAVCVDPQGAQFGLMGS